MNRDTLNSLAAVFGWGFLSCIALQLIAIGSYFLTYDWMMQYGSVLFQVFPTMTVAKYEVIFFAMLMLLKTFGLVFFLTPWAALKIVAARAS